MNRNSPHSRARVVLAVTLAVGSCLASSVSGQQTAAPKTVESDPIKCWWKTDKSAVQVGEPFTLALTCGLIETSSIAVTTDVSRLDPLSLDVAPFEVVGGTRHKDIVAPPWRYFQYSYTLRLIADNQFGKDVDIPSIQLVYNVQSAGSAERGRDQVYILPLLPIRVLSLVPITATDIWDTTPETFGDIEGRLFRANGEFTAAAMFFAFAAVMAGFAVVRGVGRYRTAHVTTAPAAVPMSAVLATCIREAERLKADVAVQGWTAPLLSRALTIFRIAGAAAVGGRISQTIVKTDVPEREGQLMLRRGLLRPTWAVVSASATPGTMIAATTSAMAGRPSSSSLRSADGRDVVQQLQDALRVFSAARYGRHANTDVSALDTALENGLSSLRRLHVTTRWPMRAIETFTKAAAGFRETVLSR